MGAGEQGARRTIRAVVRFALGPWPIFPWVVFAIVFMFWFVQNLQVSLMGRYDSCRFMCVELPGALTPGILSEYGEGGISPFDPVLVVGNALVTTVVIVAILWGFSRVLPKDAEGCPSRAGYLVALIVASIVGAIVRVFVLLPIEISAPGSLREILAPNVARMFLSITVVQSISGMLTLRYARQTAVANTALATVVQQQQMVVESDERARRHVAEFLHDRVQADLLVVAMELRAVTTTVDPSVAAALERSINELERIRSIEVRSASRRLSPAFGSVGLDTALQELADPWESVMRIRMSFDAPAQRLLLIESDTRSGARTNASRDLLVAIYRVTEQAILNAASHGHAGRITVALTMPSPAELELTISDDGRGLPDGPIQRGAGSAIMDAWCAVADGSWSWIASASGTAVRASFRTMVEGHPGETVVFDRRAPVRPPSPNASLPT